MTVTTSALTAAEWAEAFTQTSNSDPELNAHGKYFTTSYLLDMTDHWFVVEVSRGIVVNVAIDPGPLDVAYQFALRASADTWRHFGVPVPEPMYHGIWAASFQRDLKLEGNLLALMQNLRCLTRQIEILRTVGVPV